MKNTLTLAGLVLMGYCTQAQTQKIKPTGTNNPGTKIARKFLTHPSETPSGKKNVHGAASNPLAINSVTTNWQPISTSINIYGVLIDGEKPLQYNPNVNAVSFIHRKGPYYTAAPADNSGAMIAMISTDFGSSWDSTCIWSDGSSLGRYPQGAIYSAPGNTNIANAYVVGSGIVTDGGNWVGSWYASKQLGAGNYNAAASGVSNAMQFLPNTPPYAAAGKHDYSAYSFASTNDGKVRSMAYLCNDINGSDIGLRGFKIITGTFNAGVFSWAGDSLIPNVVTRTDGSKHLGGTPVMAWSQDGVIGYAIFTGAASGATGSNQGYQPIIYKTTNSGGSWASIPSIDFSSPTYSTVLKRISAVNNSTVVIPQFNTTEGIDATVDVNGKLHLACTIAGTSSMDVDSLDFTYQFTSEGYQWPYTAGARPYLYDFYGDGTSAWNFLTIDSLTSEGPSDLSGNAGYADNPWDEDAGQKVRSGSRIQLSRTADGKYVFFTWAESDSNFTTGQKKWNTIPDIKVRLLDIANGIGGGNYSISPVKQIPSKVGNNTQIVTRAMFHFAAPVSATFAPGQFIVPLTVTNSNPYSQLTSNTHYFFGAPMSFTTVGISENLASIKNFGIYPNPAKDEITISLDALNNQSTDIIINDIVGKKIKQIKTNLIVGENKFNVNTSELSKGIYLVTIKSGNSSETKKLVIE